MTKMSKPLFFSAKSIGMSERGDRKPQPLMAAAMHNMRELQAESGGRQHISMELSHLNQIFYGPATAAGIVALANELKLKYAVPKRKLRKDHVQALEFLISVRADTDIDTKAYFEASKNWLISVFGREMVLSAVVHFDEAAPHMHALVLPIVDGQYQGGAPIDKTHLPKLTKRFADQVGKPFGLSFEPKQKMHAAARHAAFKLVVDRLTEQSDPVLDSQIWSAVVESIQKEPAKYVETLGLTVAEMPRVKSKTLTQIMTGIGRRTSEDRDRRWSPTPILCRTTNSSDLISNPGVQP